MKTVWWWVIGVACILVVSGLYMWMQASYDTISSTRTGVNNITCNNVTFEYPTSWYVWVEKREDGTGTDECTFASFPEARAIPILIDLAVKKSDVVVFVYVEREIKKDLGEYVVSQYCDRGNTCMEPYLVSTTSVHARNGMLIKALSEGGHYGVTHTHYYYKKGDTVVIMYVVPSNTELEKQVLETVTSIK